MLTQIKRWLEPPHFEGDEDTINQTRIANTLIIYLGAALLIAIFILIPIFALQKIGSWILTGIMFGGLVVGRYYIFHGRLQLGSTLIFAMVYLCILVMLILSGGESSTAMFYFATIVLVAGYFLDARLVNGLTIPTFLIAMLLALLQNRGVVFIPKVFAFNSVFSWFATALGLIFMIRIRDLFVGNLKNALALAREQNAARQQVEATLRESEEKFKAQYKGIPMPTYTWQMAGADLILTDYNDRAFEFTEGRIVNLIGKSASVIYRDDPETFSQLLECSRTQANLKQERWHRLASTGEQKHLAIHYAFVPPNFVMIHTEDITERKQAEVELRLRESYLTAILENQPGLVWLKDADGRFLAVNQSFADSCGQASPADLTGKTDLDIWPPELAEKYRVDDARIIENKTSVIVEEPIFDRGQMAWFETFKAPVLDDRGKVIGTTGYARDITGRKQAEKALKESEEMLQSIFASTPDSITVVDINGVIKLCNQPTADVHGYASAEQLIGKNFIELVAEEDRQRAMEGMTQVMLNSVVKDMPFTGLKSNGEKFAGELSVSTIKDKSGNPSGFVGITKDVTGRIQAEERLNLLKHSIDAAPDGAYWMDAEGRFIYANDAGCKALGYDFDELLQLRVSDINPRATPERWSEVWQVIKDKKSFTTESVHRRKDGSEYPVELTSTYIKFGEREYCNGFARDITERKQAEEALRQRNQFLIDLQNTTLELVSQLDLKTLLENIVRRACAFVGTDSGLLDLVDPVTNQLIPQIGIGALEESLYLPVQPGEGLTGIVWQTGEMLVVPDYDQWAGRLGKFNQGILDSVVGLPLISGSQALGVLAIGSPHGSTHKFDSASIEILNQFARLATVAVQNARLFANLQAELSERKRIEQALRESEYKFRSLIEQSSEGVVLIDEQNRIIEWNPAQEKITGIPMVEALGAPYWEIQYRILPPERQAQRSPEYFKQAMEAALANGQIPQSASLAEINIQTPTGERKSILQVSFPIRTENGYRIGSVVRDITERKRAEAEIRQLNASLEQRVEERTQELRGAQEQIVRQEKMAVLGQLAGGMGHELRNPLGVISNAVYFLKLVLPDAGEKIKEYLDLIEREIHTSEKIVTDLLDFARIESAQRSPVPVSELVRQTLERFPAPAFVDVSLNLPADLPPVFADPKHVIQILGNLVVNAYQSMASTRLRRSTDPAENRKFTISASLQDAMIAIAVRDTGTGIFPENMQKIFEPHFLIESKGIGLEMAISKKLAEANGGRIEAQSEVGKGSTFTLWLPITQEANK
jgi:PAS domain S-box-containing protein